MKKVKIRRQAFSLIELSIVIIVIGILIAGVIQGSNLLRKSRLQNARTLTQSAPISSIKNLVAWWESTSQSSFIDSETNDESSITTWYDINPQSTIKFDLKQSDADDRPVYMEDSINHLPAVYFDGTSSYFSIPVKQELNPENMTIFAVVNLLPMVTNGAIISSRNYPPHQGYMMYASPSVSTFYEFWTGTGSGWIGEGVSAIEVNHRTTELITVTNDGATVIMYQNGESLHSQSQTIAVNRTTDLRVGAGRNESTAGYFFKGYIGELVIYDRVLKRSERQDIEEYLGQKWNIGVLKN